MTTPTASQTSQKPVLVVDYGAQYAQLIARRVREANVYSEVVPHTYTTEQLLAKNPAAIILSGGPSSVYADGAPCVGADLFEAGIPVFGICYGFQAMANALGGKVDKTGLREYGSTQTTILGEGRSVLEGMPQHQNTWMSHGDSVHEAPEGFEVLATTAGRRSCRLRQRREVPLRRAVAPRGQALGLRPAGAGELPVQGRQAGAQLDHGEHPRRAGGPDPQADRRCPGHLRPLRRR